MKLLISKKATAVCACALLVLAAYAQQNAADNVLKGINGAGEIQTAEQWERIAKPQILEFFDSEVYGAIPPRPDTMKFTLAESSDGALGGIAKRLQYKITVGGTGGEKTFDVLVYLPKNAKGKIPAFVCPNFHGNHTVSPEKEVFIPACFLRDAPADIEAREKTRGSRLERIPVKEIVERGFAIATFCYCDIYPDYVTKDGASESIYNIFSPEQTSEKLALAAWAWGNMRAADLLGTLPEINSSQIALAGHSRLAKTAIITGAHDKRFALVCVNNGGCKSIRLLPNLKFKYWFSQNLRKYVDNGKTGVSVAELEKLRNKDLPPPPLDQWHLLACIAPRLLYIAASSDDTYAPPQMMLSSLKKSCPAFALYGAKNLPAEDFSGKTFSGDVGYHVKEAPHSIDSRDWKLFMDFAEKHGWNKK